MIQLKSEGTGGWWVADFSQSKQKEYVLRLFGSLELPTPFTTAVSREEVVKTIAHNWKEPVV